MTASWRVMLILLPVLLTAAAWGADPVISKSGDKHVIVLPRPMQQALLRYDRSFAVWGQDDYLPSLLKHYEFTAHQALFAVIGDMNGDKKADVVLHGHNKSHDLIICVLSRGKSYRVVEIEKMASPIPKRSATTTSMASGSTSPTSRPAPSNPPSRTSPCR